VFHNQSQKIGTLNNWPSNTLGSVKYLQPTTVWSQTHCLRHQLGEDTTWQDSSVQFTRHWLSGWRSAGAVFPTSWSHSYCLLMTSLSHVQWPYWCADHA